MACMLGRTRGYLPLELVGERLDVDQALHVDLPVEALYTRLQGTVGLCTEYRVQAGAEAGAGRRVHCASKRHSGERCAGGAAPVTWRAGGVAPRGSEAQAAASRRRTDPTRGPCLC